jgi:hypothetical protein
MARTAMRWTHTSEHGSASVEVDTETETAEIKNQVQMQTQIRMPISDCGRSE